MIALIRRAWAHRRLRKGRCRWCYAVLRDDATARFCGDGCRSAHEADLHPII